MKINLTGLILFLLFSCTKSEERKVLYIGKLVKQGICLNYVIEVNNPNFPSEYIEEKWIDEFSKIEYNNVFTLESVCDFPDDIKEGDSFRFEIGNNNSNFCAVCEAYTPIPSKRLKITVID